MESFTDSSLNVLLRDELVAESIKLRSGIRVYRDWTEHKLCWLHPCASNGADADWLCRRKENIGREYKTLAVYTNPDAGARDVSP